MDTNLDALVSNGESSVGCRVRQDEGGCGTGDRRNSTIDGPGKPAHQERASPDRRPLVIRAQSIHRSRLRLLIRPEELFSADTVPRHRSLVRTRRDVRNEERWPQPCAERSSHRAPNRRRSQRHLSESSRIACGRGAMLILRSNSRSRSKMAGNAERTNSSSSQTCSAWEHHEDACNQERWRNSECRLLCRFLDSGNNEGLGTLR